jgi:hypothetical protein
MASRRHPSMVHVRHNADNDIVCAPRTTIAYPRRRTRHRQGGEQRGEAARFVGRRRRTRNGHPAGQRSRNTSCSRRRCLSCYVPPGDNNTRGGRDVAACAWIIRSKGRELPSASSFLEPLHNTSSAADATGRTRKLLFHLSFTRRSTAGRRTAPPRAG